MLKYFILVLFFRIIGLITVPVHPDSFKTWIAFSRGFSSDIFLALCLWFVLEKVPVNRLFRIVSAALLIVVCAVNYEHIHANGSNLNFYFLKYGFDETFILGSFFAVKNIPLLGVCVFNLWLFRFLGKHFDQRFFKWKTVLLVLLLSVLGSFCVPLKVGFPYWAQMNFVEENSRNLINRIFVRNDVRSDGLAGWEVQNGILVRKAGSLELMEAFYSQDLSGEKIINTPTSLNNVLIVMVEGLSYDLIDQGKLPFLAELKNEGLFFNNFITLQRQTNRGMYAALCGDYPNYLDTSAKMDFALKREFGKECLPSFLKEKGYHSVFMQSSNSHYMNKGSFVRTIGYDEDFGSRAFLNPIARSNWGVDDRSLYQKALEKIESLDQAEPPWMLTLLTVGTHHPYLVPGVPAPTREQALEYADETLQEFIEALRERGQLDNTLVVITSDEAAFSYGKNELERALSQHHAPLIIVGGPVAKPMALDGYFTQADLLLSFADFLDVDLEGGIGRSIFRRYSNRRNLIFGNVYTSKLYSYFKDDGFYVCDQEFNCESYASAGDFFRDTPSDIIQGTSRTVELLREAYLHNDLTKDKVFAGEAILSSSLR